MSSARLSAADAGASRRFKRGAVARSSSPATPFWPSSFPRGPRLSPSPRYLGPSVGTTIGR